MNDTNKASADRSSELFRLVAEHSAIGLCLMSPSGHFEWVNPAMCRLLGRQASQLLGMTWSHITHPDDVPASRAMARRLSRGEADSERAVRRYLRPDGTVLWCDSWLARLRDSSGELDLFVGQMLDVSAAVKARQELAASEERFRMLAENASDVVSRSGPDGVLQWVSPSVTERFGWRPEELIGRNAADLLHPDDLPESLRRAEMQMGGTPTTNRVRVRCANGSYRWISATVRPLLDESGRLLGRVAGWRDAEAEAAAEEALAASEEHFRLLAENTSDVIVKTDAAGIIAWVSPSSRTALGWPAYEVLGVSLSELLHPDDVAEGCLQQLGEADKGRCEVRVRTASGGWLWMSDAWHTLPTTSEFAGGVIHSLRDIQSEREAREALQFLAYHDPLTRLATRTVANVRLGQLLGGDRRGAAAVAVLFVDIDCLKSVNDTLGHAAGDQAIQSTAQRLLRSARASDLVARFGGDEFLVLLTDVSCAEDVASAAERIRRDAAQPMLVEGHEVRLTVSIGVALVAPGSDPEAALRLADAALYRAKRSGRDRFVLDGALVPVQSAKSAVPDGYNFSTGA